MNLTYHDLVAVISHWYAQQMWHGLHPLASKNLLAERVKPLLMVLRTILAYRQP
jgi:hypothetical protein